METTNDLLIDDTQKSLFCNMLDIGIDATMAKKIMSFWMFLKSKGFENIHKNILVAGPSFLPCACAEAEMALAFLERENNPLMPKPSISLPNTWIFASSNLSPRDVLGDKENVSSAILAFQNNVYDAAFKDILDKKGTNVNLKCPNVKDVGGKGEGSSENREVHASKLNPSADEWSPALVSEEKRSLFMTFSKSAPLSEAEILDYFQSQHGDCVEDVYIHTPRNRNPEFGKIVFKFSWIPNQILQNKESVILNIGEKTIGLKKYKPS